MRDAPARRGGERRRSPGPCPPPAISTIGSSKLSRAFMVDVDVRALRVVVEGDAAAGRVPTRSGAATPRKRPIAARIASGETPASRAHAVAASTFSTLCCAAQEDLDSGADLLDVTVELRRDPAVADEHPVRQLTAPAEPEHAAPAPREASAGGAGVVGVQDRAVGRRLVREDPRLGLPVRRRRSRADRGGRA